PPLHIAIERGSLEMVEMLIRLGADVNSVNEYGRNPIELAEYYGHESISTMLKNHDQIPRTCRTDRLAYNINGDAFIHLDPDIPEFKQNSFVGSAHRSLESIKEMAETNPDFIYSRATTSELAIEAGAH